MKLFSIYGFQIQPSGPSTLLKTATELSRFWFYQKRPVGQSMSSFSKTVAERTAQGHRGRGHENKYTAHMNTHGGSAQLAAVIITDQEYPAQAAFALLAKVLDEFAAKMQLASWSSPATIAFPEPATYIKYQDPGTIIRELNEAEIVAVVDRSDCPYGSGSRPFAGQAKMFYKTKKKQNNTCVIM
ncbi:Longin-like domain-containing protein [Mycena rosella]|uniref:Longin-like domain-containing protein n=1 Tax=Mycena rosella TaxID=1033263 RepID=A0AAD7CPP4_MYCRO|nr:Longin-like domain-containing protein [Mycena rosella]